MHACVLRACVRMFVCMTHLREGKAASRRFPLILKERWRENKRQPEKCYVCGQTCMCACACVCMRVYICTYKEMIESQTPARKDLLCMRAALWVCNMCVCMLEYYYTFYVWIIYYVCLCVNFMMYSFACNMCVCMLEYLIVQKFCVYFWYMPVFFFLHILE